MEASSIHSHSKEDVATFENTVEDGNVQTPPHLVKLDRQTVLRLDLMLLPLVMLMYLLAYLDRANIGNARVAGLATDLSISDYQYKLAITVTYIPYILVEIPSNLLLKKIGPGILLPVLCTCWGLVTTLQSQVSSYRGLIACRFFLGMMEGGLYPGIILYLSGFYKRSELQVRVAFFFTSASLSGAFSGLLAAAIQQMDGLRGIRGWQWIFLLEGLFTICFGLLALWLMPNGPAQVKTFKPEHVKQCQHRLELDSNSFENERVTFKAVISIFKDVQVWLSLPCYFVTGSLGLGLGYFSPTIVQALGYGRTETQLLTVPPYVLALICTMVTAYISDRYGKRGVTAFSAGLLALAGAVLMYRGRGFGARYTGIMFLVAGSFSNAPSLLSWLPNNIAGHARRATMVGTLAVCTSLGGVVSTWIYPTSSAPYFPFAAKFNISLICIMEVLILVLLFWLKRQNKRKEEESERILQGMENLGVTEQFARLGDHHPNYKYIY